ncbi:hypothetical protein DFP72DRAFT_1070067 [Ephemerocybe angulata]|uniref:DUF6593 domain-containing protein n=1 Tax=Ephemerocybe angulata TaxID=980116 RepID=A0A8H6M4K2_9AGAR|nr:hypothetical protein DFP72DRAFT_1070067 [Tulosesus angulatus]
MAPTPSMRFYLTTRDPYDTNYCTEEGQVIYKAVSPYKLINRKASIYKIVPSDPNDMRDQFEAIAEIEYHDVSSTMITWGGERKSSRSMFRKGGIGWLGSDRIFTGPDGKEYCWKLANTKPVLYTNDKTETHVAKFNQAALINLSNKLEGKANLEIYPAGEHMVDLIVVTLCYIEKLRRDRERSAASS